jgi:hypothetical protein
MEVRPEAYVWTLIDELWSLRNRRTEGRPSVDV